MKSVDGRLARGQEHPAILADTDGERQTAGFGRRGAQMLDRAHLQATSVEKTGQALVGKAEAQMGVIGRDNEAPDA